MRGLLDPDFPAGKCRWKQQETEHEPKVLAQSLSRFRERAFATLLAAACATFATSCDEGSGSYASGVGPAPTIVGTTFDQYMGSDGSITGVPLHPLIVIRFSRIMAASSVSRLNFSISSGPIANVAFLMARADPVERTIVITMEEPSTGQPAFAPATAYELHIASSGETTGNATTALAAYDGAEFVGETVIAFTTEATRPAAEVDQTNGDPITDPSSDNDCYALDVLEFTCTGSLCHGSTTGTPTAPALDLDFTSSAAIAGTTVSHPSTLAQEGSGGVPGPTPDLFPYGMNIVEPGDSTSSFLMYKVLAHAPLAGTGAAFGAPFTEFDVPGEEDDNASVVADLATRVPGSPMPQITRLNCTDSAGQPAVCPGLGWGDLRALRRWIDQGAHTPSDAACNAAALRRPRTRRFD